MVEMAASESYLSVITHSSSLSSAEAIDVSIYMWEALKAFSLRRVVSLNTYGYTSLQSMREFYMRDAHGFLLVFSITSMSPLHELADLREQIIQIKAGDQSIPIVLIGNKSDLEENRVVSRSRAFHVSQA